MSPLTNTPNTETLVEGNADGQNRAADSMKYVHHNSQWQVTHRWAHTFFSINHHDLGPTIGYSEEPESTQEDHDLSSKCAPYSLYSWERAPQFASSPSRPSESSENGV